MNKFTTNIPALTNLCDRLNAANVKGAKPILTTLGNYPSVQTWEAYTLIGRAAAKFSYDKMICADLLDLQYKYYTYAKLSEVTPEIISDLLDINVEADAKAVIEAKRLAAMHAKNEELAKAEAAEESWQD